jgi:hypothetical protein
MLSEGELNRDEGDLALYDHIALMSTRAVGSTTSTGVSLMAHTKGAELAAKDPKGWGGPAVTRAGPGRPALFR